MTAGAETVLRRSRLLLAPPANYDGTVYEWRIPTRSSEQPGYNLPNDVPYELDVLSGLIGILC